MINVEIFQRAFFIAASLIISAVSLVQAATVSPPSAQLYTVQAEDTLPRLADKFYRDPAAWPAIWQATNAAATKNPKITALDTFYIVKPGQQLFVPLESDVEQFRAEFLAAHHQTLPVASPQIRPISAKWLAEFTAYVEETRQHFGIPGVALALVRDNQIILAQGLGVRELGRAEPVTPETIFGIGSTTKAMNATLVATLVDDGLLSWDQPVTEIWPDFKLSDPAVTPQIRLRDLLNMSSGVRRADLDWSGTGMTAEEVMASLATVPIVAPRGQYFNYNNQMVATGGYVAALAAGGQYGNLANDYAALLQKRIFEPIGMASASLSIETAQANPNHAMPHDFTLAGETIPTYYHTDPGIAPAGGVNAHVLDMAKFLLTELNGGVTSQGVRVASTENLAETWEPQIEIFEGYSYGMGWFVESYHDVEMIWHDGDVLGFKSLLAFIPEAKTGLVLLTNRTISIGFSNSIRYRLVEMLYDLEVEAGSQYKAQWDAFMEALPTIREPLQAGPAPAEIAAYLGRYSDGWLVEQRDDGTVWTVRGPYQWQLLSAGGGNFVINNGFGITSEIQFTADAAGEMGMMIKLSTGETGVFRRLEQ